MPQDTVTVQAEIYDHGTGEYLCFALPPVYADNPVLEAAGKNVHNIALRDHQGNPCTCSIDSMQIGPQKNGIITFAQERFPVTLEYDVTFNYVDTVWMPPPYIGEIGGYCPGHYLFAVPVLNPELVNIWRDQIDISVVYDVTEGISFSGDNRLKATFSNSYELLFSTFALGGEKLLGGEWGGQEFQIVSLSPDIVLSLPFSTTVENTVENLLSDMTGSFGTLGWPITAILGVVEGGGIEGYHAFAVMRPDPDDTLGVFNMVLTHEILHSWIGIRTGDREDPWFKEGITNYLGFLIAKRNNHCAQSYCESVLLKDIKDSSDVKTYALSDPSNRTFLFSEIDSRTELVYVKGAQVGMLLDRRLRDGPSGYSLDKVIGAFVRQYDGTAFYRSQWVDFMESMSGSQVDDIFEKYVDAPGGIPDSVLQDAYSWLADRGAFGSVAFIAKRRQVDAGLLFRY
ncbi:MAG: hypothetical protein GF350_16690 [Chitinivibrionales bacterium]|nr:hypothetical protein [Chitinivibrionales bacterium]